MDRVLADTFELRADQAPVQKLRALPNTSVTEAWPIFFPRWLRYKISGKNYGLFVRRTPGEETVVDLAVGRQIYVDRIIDKASSGADSSSASGRALTRDAAEV